MSPVRGSSPFLKGRILTSLSNSFAGLFALASIPALFNAAQTEFRTYADQFYSDPSPEGMISLGLYLGREFGILQTKNLTLRPGLAQSDFYRLNLPILPNDIHFRNCHRTSISSLQVSHRQDCPTDFGGSLPRHISRCRTRSSAHCAVYSRTRCLSPRKVRLTTSVFCASETAM